VPRVVARLVTLSTRAARISVVAWVTALGACRATPPASPEDRAPALVAAGDGVSVTVADLEAAVRLSGRPPREVLAQMVAFELLATAAARREIEPDPEDKDRLRQVEVQRFLAERIEPRLAPSQISDAQVRELYEKGRGQYVHPRLVKVALLAVFTGARMRPESRRREEGTARALAEAVAKEDDKSSDLFARLGHEPGWLERHVSYGEVWQAANGDHPYPRLFGEAVARLRRAGDTTPLVCEESGCYLGRYIDERPPEDVPYEDVAATLRSAMTQPWQRRRFVELVGELAGSHEIGVDPDALAALGPVPP